MTLDPRLQEWLDGELSLADLPEELRADAGKWTELLETARALPAPGAGAGATTRVMQAIRDDAAGVAPADGGLRAVLGWFVRPLPLRVSPLAAAALVALVAWSAVRLASVAEPAGDELASAADGRVYVQFVIAAPGARSVALAGDFNEWDPSIQLSDPDGDGTWTARVGLEAGVHEYMFVIDGTEWRPDPNALAYTADGFGQRNSVLAVAPLDDT